MIVEFFGMPGCGKSTISHQIAQILKKEGDNIVYEASYCVDHSMTCFNRKIFKLVSSLYWSIFHVKLSIKIIMFIVKYNYSNFFSDYVDITYKLRIIEKKTREYRYIFFDEGIAQTILSMLLASNSQCCAAIGELLEIIDEKEGRMFFYLEERIDVALNRINKRVQEDSCVDRASNNHKKKELLKQFLCGCENIKKYNGKMHTIGIHNLEIDEVVFSAIRTLQNCKIGGRRGCISD